MHAIEKILAKNSGKGSVKTGEIVTAKIDFAEINDLYLQTVYSFYEMGERKSGIPNGVPSYLNITRPARISRAHRTIGRCARSQRKILSNIILIQTAGSVTRSCRKPASSTRV